MFFVFFGTLLQKSFLHFVIYIFYFFGFLLFYRLYFIIVCQKLQGFKGILFNILKFFFILYLIMNKLFRGDFMSDKMDDLFNNVKKMVDSGNIPDDIKKVMNNLQNSSNSNNNDINNILNQVSPDMINNLNNMLNSNTQSNQSFNNSNNMNIDMNTILKMKNIMDNMNKKDDPRANLLHSLKPYLRDSRKDKLDQYVNLLNISKIADIMNNNKENKNE